MQEITREEFEAALSIAASATMQVYERLQPALLLAQETATRDILGDPGAAAVDTDTLLHTAAVRYISVKAVLDSLAQLDLVLTPTGFGVVQNETTAPASKDRVERLRLSLLNSSEEMLGDLLERLTKVSGWNQTRQAAAMIPTVMWNIRQLERRWRMPIDSEEWQQTLAASHLTHDRLVRLVGLDQMNELLDLIRTDSLQEPYTRAVSLMETLTLAEATHSPDSRRIAGEITLWMESNPEAFATYIGSDAYEANHWQRFSNTQDSPAYCFMG